MRRAIGVLARAVALAVLAAGAVFVLGMRSKYPPVVDAARRISRTWTNPRLLRTAGRPGSYAAVLHHVGRTSRRPYQTPVVVAPTEDGFVVALPYGTQVDWLKNVLSIGTATIVDSGERYLVDQPRVVATAEVQQYFSADSLRAFRFFKADRSLRVHEVSREPV